MEGMENKSVLIRFEEGQEQPWRLYWTSTMELADSRSFATIEEAGKAARALVFPTPKPELKLIEGSGPPKS